MVTITTENIQEEIKGAAGTLLVDFYADWCGPCKMQTPILEELEKEMNEVKFCKINIDEQPQLARDYAVMSIPTIMVIKAGEVVYKEPGLMQKRELVNLLKK